MNIHHLELFYYVARFGGITEAVRNIPYGIQQPAVSGQVAQLEEYLGVTLFQRRPFALTPHGQKLYRFIEPFFANIPSVAAELQGGKAAQVRIGASGIVLRDHLPQLFQVIRKRFPKLKVILREGYQSEVEAMLLREELDLAVTVLERKTSPGIHSVHLIDLPLIMLVDEASAYKTAAQLWEKDKIPDSLICLPEHESICRHFQQGLARLGQDWFPGIEVSSLDLIETYVKAGFGIGLSVQLPRAPVTPGIRVLPLADFAPIRVGALWRGKPSVVVQAFIDEMQLRAKVLK